MLFPGKRLLPISVQSSLPNKYTNIWDFLFCTGAMVDFRPWSPTAGGISASVHVLTDGHALLLRGSSLGFTVFYWDVLILHTLNNCLAV